MEWINYEKKLLIISFILILIVAVMGIGGTIYFYNKFLSISTNSNSSINTKSDTDTNNDANTDVSNIVYNDENATDFTF